MKIEMGESLFYSWLRHAKACPIVQSNWKPSPSWQRQNEKEIERLMSLSAQHFKNKFHYEVFKDNELSQLLQQAEIDVLGVSWTGNGNMFYAVDVAYHESGLNYGNKEETTTRVIKKFIRSAMCLRCYFNAMKAEIIFASPKINTSSLKLIEPTIIDINNLLHNVGFDFSAKIIANKEFKNLVLKAVMEASNYVSDTSELFLRAYQLVKMFDTLPKTSNAVAGGQKIGIIAQTVLRNVLQSCGLSKQEIESMQNVKCSKQMFGTGYPLLATKRDPDRYYADPLNIDGDTYYLCNDWYEKNLPLLMKWLNEHK